MKIHELKNGHTTTDRRLDRIAQFDERSRGFSIRTLTGLKPLRSYSWRCSVWLDQGKEGACVGFGWSQELAARPVEVKSVTDAFAFKLYKEAQQLDETPGDDYEGTSVLAGAKAVLARGFIASYHWAFGLNDILLALGYAGPVVLGVNWYSNMFKPDAQGFLWASGELSGGHCILARSVHLQWLTSTSPKLLANVDKHQSYVVLHNSWGKSWGQDGEAKLSLLDLERLLGEQGEACVPSGRKMVMV